MVKECLIRAILIVYENTNEIYRHCVQVDLHDLGVAKKCQVHLWHKTWPNLTDINTCENICLIQACIYCGYYKTFSRGLGIMTIHHQPL